MKFAEFVEDKRFSLSLDMIDAELRKKGRTTVTQMLAENKLDAIAPGETRVKAKE